MKYLACIVGGCVQWSKLTTKKQEHAVNQDRQSSKLDLRTHCSQRSGDFVLFLFDGISVFIMPERQLCEICHFLQAQSIEKHQFEVEKMKRSLLSAILRGIPYLADRY